MYEINEEARARVRAIMKGVKTRDQLAAILSAVRPEDLDAIRQALKDFECLASAVDDWKEQARINGRKGRRPRMPDSEVSAGALKMREYRARKRGASGS